MEMKYRNLKVEALKRRLLSCKCLIVPVALIDSFKPFDTNTISQVTVQVHFLEPILYEEYQNMKTTEIAEIVKKRIEKVIHECTV